MTEVTIIRHPKERISKCSLKHLHQRPSYQFFKAKEGFRFDATGFVVLALDAPVLSLADKGKPLLLLDSTWRLLPYLLNCVEGEPIYRSLPSGLATAYPRVSKLSEDPSAGLASIEALYCALKLVGEDDVSLLEQYYWKEQFLENMKKAGV